MHFNKNYQFLEDIDYISYYKNLRPHLGIDKQIPKGSSSLEDGTIMSEPILGGLHSHYFRDAALQMDFFHGTGISIYFLLNKKMLLNKISKFFTIKTYHRKSFNSLRSFKNFFRPITPLY